MKKNFLSLMAILMVAVVSACFVSCSKDDSNNNEESNNETSIVGTWRRDFSWGYILLTLNPDGTGLLSEYEKGKLEYSDPISYYFDKEKDKYMIIEQDGEYTYITPVQYYDKTTLVVMEDGETKTWTRVTSDNGNNNEESNNSGSIIGTWLDQWGEGPRSYTAYTFFEKGKGLYFDKGNGAEAFTYTYNPQSQSVIIVYSEYDKDELSISKSTSNGLTIEGDEYKKTELTYDMLILGEWNLHVGGINTDGESGKSTRVVFTADWKVEGTGTYEAKDYYNSDASDEWYYSFSGLSGKVSGTWSITDNRLSIKGQSQIAGEYIIEGLVVNGCRLVRASNPDEYPYLTGGWWHQRIPSGW